MVKRTWFRYSVLGACVLLACPNLPATFAGCGFGVFKMDVFLNRKSPPKVYIMGTAINVRASSLVARGNAYSAQLASTLESELLSHDNRLKPESGNPETIISCQITRLESAEKWEDRRTTESRKTGERQEWNAKTQKYETKPVYQDVEVTRRFQVLTGSLAVNYQVKDVKTGATLDSDSLPLSYAQDFLDGNGAPSPVGIENDLVRRAALVIVPRLVPTNERVKVLLSKGKFEKAAKLGQAGLWQKMVEALETMEPLTKPQDDSYRLYNIGVGYEALAYQAEDPAATRKFLDKASGLYNQALEMKPDEKYFREPQRRIEQAITQYRKLADQIGAYERAVSLQRAQNQPVPQAPAGIDGGKGIQPPTTPRDPVPVPSTPGDSAFTNRQVLTLAGSGIDDANLIEAIKRAPAVRFDLGPEALAALLQNKVSNTVIAAMRARQDASGVKPKARPRRSK